MFQIQMLKYHDVKCIFQNKTETEYIKPSLRSELNEPSLIVCILEQTGRLVDAK